MRPIDQWLKNGRIEYEHTPDPLAMLERVIQRRVVARAQVAAKPYESVLKVCVELIGAGHDRLSCCASADADVGAKKPPPMIVSARCKPNVRGIENRRKNEAAINPDRLRPRSRAHRHYRASRSNTGKPDAPRSPALAPPLRRGPAARRAVRYPARNRPCRSD